MNIISKIKLIASGYSEDQIIEVLGKTGYANVKDTRKLVTKYLEYGYPLSKIKSMGILSAICDSILDANVNTGLLEKYALEENMKELSVFDTDRYRPLLKKLVRLGIEPYEIIKRFNLSDFDKEDLSSLKANELYELYNSSKKKVFVQALENNNIIMIAGGSKVWGNNYIDPNETSTYQLKENGFEKVKQDGVKNMGDANTLLDFLNYAYEFYPAKKYELIFWNHGSGIVGLESDDIYGDMLNFSELQMAFSKSPFKEEKLDSILFINCLLGNIELAGVIDDYADYMIASEEISYTHPFVDKFKFFEEITVEDNGFEFGKKFVDNLTSNNFLNANAKSYNTPTTYSIIDLSKISQVERDLNNFVKAINLNQDYEQIALSRSSMFQYGGEYLEFDMIDLSSFVSKLQALAPTEASKLISSLSEAIVYNYSLDSTSKGLSVYFPYNAEKKNVDFQIKLLEELENSSANDYLAFIKNFDLYRRTKTSYSMDLTNNKVNTLSGDFSMQLSEGQQKDFASASYIIVKESTKGNFTPIYFSDNTTLDSNGKLKANFDGKIVMALDTVSNQMLPIVAYEKQNGTYMTTIQLENTDKGISSNANAYISFQGGDGKIHLAVEKVDNEKLEMQLPDMSILTLENYQKLVFTNHDYAISNGNGGVSNKWTSSGEEHKVNALVNHYKIQKVDIDRTAKYYFAFKVRDLSNEITYSKLVEIK